MQLGWYEPPVYRDPLSVQLWSTSTGCVASKMLSHAPTISSAGSSVLAFAGRAAEGGINIDLDLTFTMQMLVFVILIVTLKPLLFDPVLKIFEEREKRTDGARQEARDMQKRAGELLRKYEAELVRINRTAAEERDRIRAETARLEAQILDEARASTAKVIAEGRAEIDELVRKTEFELGKQSERLGRDIATRALGRELV
jgi:F-type H+-transporting ATPase subunit b